MAEITEWILTSRSALVGVMVSVLGVYVGLLVLTRVGGLRSFSKMSSFDFAVTVAIGSVLASTILAPDPPLLTSLAALTLLYVAQLGVAAVRVRSSTVATMVDNQPLLLMRGQEVLHDNLRKAKVSEADLRAKLRAANVLSLNHVQAVVFESTGDVSVLHGEPDRTVDRWLLEGVAE